MRFERREQLTAAGALLPPVAAVAFTLAVGALLVAWAGAPVGRSYALLLEGGFGSRFALTETLTRATPLILTGLAAAVAFRARLYNIGAEGQLYPAHSPPWPSAASTAATAWAGRRYCSCPRRCSRRWRPVVRCSRSRPG